MKLLIAQLATLGMSADVKVIGGAVVTPHSEPHILSMQKLGSHFCGATLISATHGVCAAHCDVYNNVNAVAGAHNIMRTEESQQSVPAVYTINPAYNSNTFVNDISVLKFGIPFVLDTYVVPIPMPDYQPNEWLGNDAVVRVCGWGNTSVISDNYPAELHCVETKIISVDICNERAHYNGQILKGMFCAGEVNVGGKDACQGDSGGPVTWNGMVIGATSWGFGCAYPNYPGVYTDIAQYRDWVDSQTNMISYA